MNDLIDLEPIPTIKEPAISNLAETVFRLIEHNKKLQKEVETLKQRLETSRKLQIKPKLYPPDLDPYYGEEDGA